MQHLQTTSRYLVVLVCSMVHREPISIAQTQVAKCLLCSLAAWAMQGFGVYRFASKYGANVDGYSPIYTPDSWAETGDSYSLGTKGLLAWYCPASHQTAQG